MRTKLLKIAHKRAPKTLRKELKLRASSRTDIINLYRHCVIREAHKVVMRRIICTKIRKINRN